MIDYDPSTFPKRLEEVMNRDARTGTRFVLYGGNHKQRQQALSRLAHYATGNLHQSRLPSLLSDYRIQTQNNLRKAFDHAAEERALLYFDTADRIFTHTHSDASTDSDDGPAPTTVEYFLDRIEAYQGMIGLALQRKRHTEQIRPVVDLVVHFE